MCFGGDDREGPAVAGDVPVELVVTLEEAELARREVVDHVRVLAVRDVSVRIANPYPDAVARALGVVRFRPPVALDASDVEADADATPVALVGGREITEDPVVDLVSLRH
jgi:hypothetical protein